MNVKKKIFESDLERIDKMTDQDIDYSDIPELDESFFEGVEVQLPKIKERISLRLDAEVLAWFRDEGPGYQTRINAVLKSYMKAHNND